jgi:hypothetical protein
VAAHLAAGVAAARFGKPITTTCGLDFDKPQRTGKRTWTGAILQSTASATSSPTSTRAISRIWRRATSAWRLARAQVSVVARNYAECGPGELF